ncbi:MAG TPA: GTPase HflX [Anaerolineaceae bacterium]|uniref:GTPase HflX n=1 Tax=Anaerolinea thermophila TaxID=167964 RepID=A0A101FYF9_9CHLR|nr:MAG: GTPase HflX [Anaerolinea thermophila]HAF62244.1 GTPase HflX [Anaerolineaceae bacterium]
MAKNLVLSTTPPREKAILVGIECATENSLLSMESSLEELYLLSDTAGVEVVGELTQKLDKPNPSTFIGSGKVNELKELVSVLQADMVIFDEELNPRNFRELEEQLPEGTKVIDRTGLILDIFAQHANTSEGKLQVQLAQYEYLYPRLTRAWTHLVRQAGGGAGRTGSVGGVGLRGPGETQLEVDRRKIREQISALKNELDKVQDHRQQTRLKRKKANMPLIAMVGYTNAGKSTLLNRLTKADVYVADQLFATLDPTTRKLWLSDGKEVLITDTVGFIQKLPHQLVAAFRATMEDIVEADLLLHVVDISNPDAYAQWQSVIQTLIEIKADDIPMLTILNKCDKKVEESEINRNFPQFQNAVRISAKTGLGMEDLQVRIKENLYDATMSISVKIPYKQMNLINLFHQSGLVENVVNEVDYTSINGKIPARLYRLFTPYKV